MGEGKEPSRGWNTPGSYFLRNQGRPGTRKTKSLKRRRACRPVHVDYKQGAFGWPQEDHSPQSGIPRETGRNRVGAKSFGVQEIELSCKRSTSPTDLPRRPRKRRDAPVRQEDSTKGDQRRMARGNQKRNPPEISRFYAREAATKKGGGMLPRTE